MPRIKFNRNVVLAGLIIVFVCIAFYMFINTYNNVSESFALQSSIDIYAGINNYGTGDGPRLNASFKFPTGLTLDSAGNIYVCDNGNFTIRKIDPGGNVSTFAGRVGRYPRDGTVPVGEKDADGSRFFGTFSGPNATAIDSGGNMYVVCTEGSTIRKIDTNGNISHYAGVHNRLGNLDGPRETAEFFYPKAIAIDRSGNLIIVDTGNHQIRKIDQSGNVSTIAGLKYPGSGIPGRNPDGGYQDGPGLSARFNTPSGIVMDSAGNFYITDTMNRRIRKLDTNGNVSTFAGSGVGGRTSVDGPLLSAQFTNPTGITMDSNENFYITEGFIRKIDKAGNVTTISDFNSTMNSGVPRYANINCPSIVVRPNGEIIASASYSNMLIKISVSEKSDCVLSSTDFEGDGNCLPTQAGKDCGPGTLMKPKKVVTPAIGGGACVNPPVSTGSCKVNNRDCAVDCVLSPTDFDGAGNCVPNQPGANCGPGTLMRPRRVLTAAVGSGSCNNPPVASGSCKVNNRDCAVDCVLSPTDFEGAGTCTPNQPGANCGPGTLMRPRRVLSAAMNGGSCNNPTIASGSCKVNNRDCPVDCVLSQTEYDGPGNCMPNEPGKDCGPGTLMRPKKVVTAAIAGGACNNPPVATGDCKVNNKDCRADCVLSGNEFEGAGTCVPNEAGKDCGPGKLMRPKKVTTAAAGGGACNNPPIVSGDCLVNNKNCPVDCVLSSTEYTGLPGCKPKVDGANCGPGIKERVWKVVKDALYGGRCENPPQVDPAGCLVNDKKCGINCTTPWTNVGTCVPKPGKTCGPGNGTQKQRRTVNMPGEGQQCNETDLATERTIDCDLRACNACVIGTVLKPVGPCISKTGKDCGEGEQKYEYDYTPPEEGGTCSGPKPGPVFKPCLVNDKKCNIDCASAAWTNQGSCEKKQGDSCGIKAGYQMQSRVIKTPSQYESCNETDLSTSRKVDCDLPECPIDCQPEPWEMAPNARCIPKDSKIDCGKGNGTIQQVRNVKPANSTGTCSAENAKTKQSIDCDLPECPIDCKPSEWSPWSKCDAGVDGKGCGPGGGTRSRMRDVKPANSTGKCSPEDSQKVQTEKCDLKECPIDCKADPWSPWSECKGTCGAGNGTTFRTRNVRNANSTGRQCGPDEQQTKETAKCDMPDCPVDCKVGPWSSWMPIGRQGNDYMLKRVRSVQLGNITGKKCTDDETRTVETKKCDSCPDLDEMRKQIDGGKKSVTYKF